MKFLKISLILSAFSVFVFACGQNASTTNTANPTANQTATANTAPNSAPTAAATTADEFASVREIYKESCVGCHKGDGSGGEKVLDNGDRIRVPSYKSPGAMNASDDKLYDYIANGEEGEMPAFKGKLTEEQMRTLVKFIRKEFQGK
jgi:mono/diheme cytochrome c family protein